MKIVIIEDERPAAEKLRKAIQAYDPTLSPAAILTNVRSAIQWLSTNPGPDLIFMDIELSDGLSFSIFKEIEIGCPVIFTTAYDEYWQEAFEHNSIDYLLKPIRKEKLEQAISKYKMLKHHFSINYDALFSKGLRIPAAAQYKKRMLIKKGTDLVSLKTEEIAYCYAAHKMACIVDGQARKFIVDKSLNDLEDELDPALFFRINRKWLVNIHHIKRIRAQSKSKLLLELDPPVQDEIIISQENSASFKQWIDG